MKSIVISLCVLIISYITNAHPNNLYSNIKQVAQSGDWNDPKTWTNENIPVAGDIIMIPTNIFLTINNIIDFNSSDRPSNIYLHGKLLFQGGGKLFLCSQSSINIEKTGSIENENTNANFDRIRIGNTIYFTGNDEALHGPFLVKKPNAITSYINLSVALVHKKALVQWTTSKEFIAGYFELQRNVERDNWITIVSVKTEAPGKELKLYKFIDKDPSSVIAKYRLRIVENSGAFAYSPVRSIRNTEPGPNVYIGAFSAENIVLHFNQEISSSLIFKLESLSGDVIKYKRIRVPVGEIKINLKDITPGNYMATLSGPSGFRYVQPVKL